MRKTPLNVIDLFSGVGGLSLGAARAGLSVVLALEKDPHAIAAHQRNFPSAVHLDEDAANVSGERLIRKAALAPADLFGVIGGPPCQGFSSIGHRCITDPRNRLFVRFFELVRELQPPFFLAENVPGIMDPANDEIREAAIALVRDDYEVLPPVRVVGSSFGAPTTRTRYLFVGYKQSHFTKVTATDFKGTGRDVRVRQALAGLPRRIFPSWGCEPKSWRQVQYDDRESPFCMDLRSNVPAGVGDPVALELLAERSLVSGFLGTVHTAEVKIRFAKLKPGQVDPVSKARRLEWDGYCPTLRAGTGADRGSYQAVRPVHPTAARVIAPREAARLQSFPDWFQFSPTKWHSFRQIGNSVCPAVAEAVLRVIISKRKH